MRRDNYANAISGQAAKPDRFDYFYDFGFYRPEEMDNPASTLFLGDSSRSVIHDNPQWYYWIPNGPAQDGDGGVCVRHSTRGNFWFADGHVESCSPAKIKQCGPTYIDGYTD
jgi:prepilin-type processing-associated H-X9-DG protein